MANDEEVRGDFDLHGSFGTSRGKLCAIPRRPLIFLGICLTFLTFGDRKERSISPSVLFMGAIQNSLQACILFRCWFLGKTREKIWERESCGLVGWLLDRRKVSFGHSVGWFLLNWNTFFGGFGEDFRINH